MLERTFFAVCATFAFCASVLAQNTRSAVSVTGNDANACTVPSPCRTFSKAVSVTNSGGEVIALDSGGYGPFTIDRAVTVRPVPGAYAGLAPSSTNGISVVAGANDDVILRGITINGLGGTNLYGIYYVSGRSLTIQRCAIDRMTGRGIVSVQSSNLFVSDTTITNSAFGIQLGNGNVGSPTVFATISNCRIDHNTYGIAVYQPGNATVSDTVLANNSTGLRAAASVATLAADVVIENSTISGNSVGISSGTSAGTATVRVSNCTISHNTFGLSSSDAQTAPILSRQNNTLQANTTNGTFDGTFTAN